MLQKLLLVPTIGLLLFLSACQKDDATNPVEDCEFPDRLAKIVFYQYQTNEPVTSTEYRVSYNEAGQLSKRSLKNSNSNTYEDYDYFEYDAQGNCTEHRWKNFSGAPSRYYQYEYIDNRRSITRFYTSISPGAPTQLMQTTSFFYENGTLTKIENAQPQFGNPPSVGTFSYADNGKKVSLSYVVTAGNAPTITVYSFSNLVNPMALLDLSFGYPDYTFALDSIQYSAQSPSDDFQYQLDSSGRVVAKIAFIPSINAYDVIERYYYDCQQ
ncbi:MAG: hypothetical protein AB8G15_02585 [Saprospiraceae bacterium]